MGTREFFVLNEVAYYMLPYPFFGRKEYKFFPDVIKNSHLIFTIFESESIVVKINGLTKRYDVVVFKPDGSIFLLVECKAPGIAISQHVFDQIARYNMSLNAVHMMVTNGLNHYFCQMDHAQEKYLFLPDLPEYIPAWWKV